jgi:hypothetical protein
VYSITEEVIILAIWEAKDEVAGNWTKTFCNSKTDMLTVIFCMLLSTRPAAGYQQALMSDLLPQLD